MLCAMKVWLEHRINLRDGFYKYTDRSAYHRRRHRASAWPILSASVSCR